MKKAHKVCVYGLGNFGFATLKHLDGNHSQRISLCAYDRKSIVTDTLRQTGKHPFFHKSTKLSRGRIKYATSPSELLEDCDILILAVASNATREVAKVIQSHAHQPLVILNTAKALDQETGKRLSEVVAEYLDLSSHTYAAMAGGTIARDLLKHEPLGVDIACEQKDTAKLLKSVIESGNLSVNTTQDLIGVEYAGAYKNVVSILAGVVKGLGFSYGAETKIISQTAQAISEVCVEALGASRRTFEMGSQCWGNDLWMSCTGNTRNREFGVLLGKGMRPDDALLQMASELKTVEGYNTLKIIGNIPEFDTIPSIKILHDIVVSKTCDVNLLKRYFLSRS